MSSFKHVVGEGSKRRAVEYCLSKDKWVASREPQPDTAATTVSSWLRLTFLPVGFPDSVREEYLEFQVCDTLQAFCSYLRGLLATKGILVSLGVGRADANVGSALLQFVVKDLSSLLISGVFFNAYFGRHFGADAKEWRFFADWINDVALAIDFMSPLFVDSFWALLVCMSLSGVFKSMCGAAANASKVTVSKHFGLRNNEADIIAKESVQETAVTIVGMLCGLFVSGSHSYNALLFATLSAAHLYLNLRAVRCLKLCTLSTQRAELIADHWLATARPKAAVPTPLEVAEKESVNVLRHLWTEAARIQLAAPIFELSAQWLEFNLQKQAASARLKHLIGFRNKDATVAVVFHEHASDFDILLGFIHAKMAVLLCDARKSALNPRFSDSLLLTEEYVERLRLEISKSDWDISNTADCLCLRPVRALW